MRKLFTDITILAISLGISCAAFANGYLQTQTEEYIHSTIVKTSTGKQEVAKVNMRLGTGDADNCQFTNTAPATPIKIPNTILLNGQELAKQFGIKYNCAQEIYTTIGGRQATGKPYKLINDGKVYIATSPNSDQVTV